MLGWKLAQMIRPFIHTSCDMASNWHIFYFRSKLTYLKVYLATKKVRL